MGDILPPPKIPVPAGAVERLKVEVVCPVPKPNDGVGPVCAVPKLGADVLGWDNPKPKEGAVDVVVAPNPKLEVDAAG